MNKAKEALIEIDRGEDKKGTDFYKRKGCYVCDGTNKACTLYHTGDKLI